MSIILANQIEKATCFLKNHLKKNNFFIKINENNGSISKIAGSKRGNKVYAYQTELKIKPIVESLTKDTSAFFITLTHRYDSRNPLDSWTYFNREIPKFIRRCKFDAYLYVYEAHKMGGCHCHLIVNGEVSIDKIKKLWDGHIKIKKIKNEKIGCYLSKEIGKAGHVESALKHADEGKLSDNDIKKIWRFYYLLKLKMRGWGTSRNLKIKESENNQSSDLISIMNNSTDEKSIVISLPKKIIKNPVFRPYCERLTEKLPDWMIIEEFLKSINLIINIKDKLKHILN